MYFRDALNQTYTKESYVDRVIGNTTWGKKLYSFSWDIATSLSSTMSFSRKFIFRNGLFQRASISTIEA